MASVKCSCMHTTEIQWYVVVCYDKLSVQQCLRIYTATELNLKRGFCQNPRNPSRSTTVLQVHLHSSSTTSCTYQLIKPTLCVQDLYILLQLLKRIYSFNVETKSTL